MSPSAYADRISPSMPSISPASRVPKRFANAGACSRDCLSASRASTNSLAMTSPRRSASNSRPQLHVPTPCAPHLRQRTDALITLSIGDVTALFSDQWKTMFRMPATHASVTVNSANFVPILIFRSFCRFPWCPASRRIVHFTRGDALWSCAPRRCCEPGVEARFFQSGASQKQVPAHIVQLLAHQVVRLR